MAAASEVDNAAVLSDLAKHDSRAFPVDEKVSSEGTRTQALDEVEDDQETPTEYNLATMRRVSDAIPWNAYREFDSSTFSL